MCKNLNIIFSTIDLMEELLASNIDKNMNTKRIVFGVMALVMMVSVLMLLKVIEPNYYYIATSFLFAAFVFLWRGGTRKSGN